jgi:hypothetical protein
MIIKINNNKALNRVRSTTYFTNQSNTSKANPAPIAKSSFINSNNKIYKNNVVYNTNLSLPRDNYPGYDIFGIQSTIQNIYSAGPQKLRIGIF